MKKIYSQYILVQSLYASLLMFPICAYANDSIAGVSAGGITLLKSEDIRMVKEILEISANKISVQYQFLNESGRDIKNTIAFPMPSYSAPSAHVYDLNNKPLRPFSTYVNGQAVPALIDRRAVKDGIDITSELGKLGLNDTNIFYDYKVHENPDDESTECDNCGVTPQQSSYLNKKKLWNWRVEETAIWEYDFPAKKTVEVLHEYYPHLGQSYFEPYSFGRFTRKRIKSSNVTPDCDGNEDNAINKAVERLAKKNPNTIKVFVTEISYILLSGKNWKGPINDFKLRIKKTNPDQVISVCFPGKPKRLSNLEFEFSEKDFVPKNDLVVYFYTIVDQY